MKTSHIALLALIVPTLVACTVSPQPAVEVGVATDTLTRNALTRAEAKTTLQLIDNICGDTWCEGDYNFAFKKLSCAKCSETCTLTLQLLPREGMADEGATYTRTCTTHGFTGFDSLVYTSTNGYQQLQDDYYAALTECIARLEEQVRNSAASI